MKTEYIQYTEVLRRQAYLNGLKSQGVELLFSKNPFKKILGVGCLVVAIIPNGLGFIFYPLGFRLLNIGLDDITRFQQDLRFKLWLRFQK